MQNIVHVEKNDLVVSIQDMADFSGIDYRSVQRMINKNSEEFEIFHPKYLSHKNITFPIYKAFKILHKLKKKKGMTQDNLVLFLTTGVNKVKETTKKVGVYLITDGTFHKVGITNNIKSRLAGIQNGNALELSVCYFGFIKDEDEYNNASILEKELHHLFGLIGERKKGEWFDMGGVGVSLFMSVVEERCISFKDIFT